MFHTLNARWRSHPQYHYNIFLFGKNAYFLCTMHMYPFKALLSKFENFVRFNTKLTRNV